MTSTARRPDDLEGRLAGLHEAAFGWACSCCEWNEADAEDVLQTTYVKVISGRARYDGRSTFRTWLFGVIRLTAREQGRRARSERKRVERLALERRAEDAVVDPGDPAVRAERARRLKQAIVTLPERQREVLHLVFYGDLTVKEAAEVMEVSIGSARVHYDRGKKRLRALLADEATSGGER